MLKINQMIQRVQTIYLAIAIILLSIITVGPNFFSFLSEGSVYSFNSYGIVQYSKEGGEIISTTSFPIFIGTIALTLLAFICLMSYKNLARQFKLGRMVFFLYLVSLISVILLAYLGPNILDEEIVSRELGVGFILFVCGFPFTFLANIGIKRDKKLLESLDRLR